VSAPALPGPCPRCTGMGDAHYLTCPTLRLGATGACGCEFGYCHDRPGCWMDRMIAQEAAVPP